MYHWAGVREAIGTALNPRTAPNERGEGPNAGLASGSLKYPWNLARSVRGEKKVASLSTDNQQHLQAESNFSFFDILWL